MLRTLEVSGSPTARGLAHGEAFRADIHGIYAIRLRLMIAKTNLGSEAAVLRLAAHHLPVLERFDRGLFDELCGIAKGAGLTPAHIVVVNHYTDLRDLNANDLARLDASDPGGCSAWFVDGGGNRVLGQTWDMHGSATPYALLLTVRGDDGSTTTCFTIMGCLGMTGMNSHGVGLTINNLNSVDATVGVVWPALVRKTLQAHSAVAARDTLLSSPIGSGRHYIVADATDAFGIETSGTKKKLIFDATLHPQAALTTSTSTAPRAYFHTNHCIDPEMVPTAKIAPGSTTVARYETLVQKTKQGAVPTSARAMFDSFADVGLTAKNDVDDVATCGALVMDLRARSLLACQGIPGPATPTITRAL